MVQKYEELRQYKDSEGHCNVPQGFSDNISLVVWVNHQRTQYKYMRQGKPSSITEQRIQALYDIGFSWNVSNTSKKPEMTPSCSFPP